MGRESDDNCTVYICLEAKQSPSQQELGQKLASKRDDDKIEALEQIILHMVNGESFSQLLMQVIQYTVTSNNHRIKKLLMLYWEIVDKYKENGEWKEEMILVCNAIRNDLLHSNEYVRGSTLRLMCKMRYYKILEPLIEAILKNLTHKHAYVRRNAVMCVFAIIKTFGIEVIPTALEDVEQLLMVEGDLSTKRNAFLMLVNCDMDRAVQFLVSTQDSVPTSGDLFQLAVLELIRKACRGSAQSGNTANMQQNKTKLLRILYNLADPALSSSLSSTAVAYDVASSLVSLTGNAQAVTTAVQNYVNLLTEQSDNNVKLVVLGKLKEVRKFHGEVVQNFVMDTFRALSSPSLDVRKKVMDLCLPLVSSKNVKEVVALFKKELIKTCGTDQSDKEYRHEYRKMLLKALHVCTMHSAEEAQTLVYLLIDFLSEADYNATANETIMYLRELVATFPEIRSSILARLYQTLPDMQHSRVLRGTLWLFSEYSEKEGLETALESTLEVLRPLPIIAQKEKEEKKEDVTKKEVEEKKESKQVQTRTVVLADGTYGTEAVQEPSSEPVVEEKKTMLKTLLQLGDYLLASCLGVALTRMVVRLGGKCGAETKNEVLFVVANLIRLLKATHSAAENNDSVLRLHLCIRLLTTPEGSTPALDRVRQNWKGSTGKEDLMRVIELEAQNSEWSREKLVDEAQESAQLIPPGEAICFRQLRRDGRDRVANTLDFDDEGDFNMARGALDQLEKDGSLFGERLANVQQMTGLADPVYVEAFLQVHSFDLLLEILLVNRTNDILQNCTVELSTQGDLKIVDRPSPVMLSPGQQQIVHASIKVSSTETGVIFGYVSFEKKSAVDKESIVLNELHVDILDYIEKGSISELKFRTMWSEFEWENKININTQFKEAGAYLIHIMKNTNMSIVGRAAASPTTTSTGPAATTTAGAVANGTTSSLANGTKPAPVAEKRSLQAILNAANAGGGSKTTIADTEDNPVLLMGRNDSKLSKEQSLQLQKESNKQSKKHLNMGEIFTQFEEALGIKKLLSQSNFVGLNLYSRSIFGEDILANISIEQIRDDKGVPTRLSGSVRIRSRAQGIALSLGERVSAVQR
ncbi:unnamed protein product [Amoebophrya sp. A120]|nr:unnamed protein product [Amoebophrya sp. A120]|eukprot:GSA120T00019984001.1